MQNFELDKTSKWLGLIRGIALEGVPNEKVNLTPDIATNIGRSFVSWLVQKVTEPASRIRDRDRAWQSPVQGQP